MEAAFLYTRTFELIVSLLIGAFLCWLGYKLFHLKLTEKSDLKLEYGRIKFQILTASPGIFFTLFGATIVFLSVWKVAEFNSEYQQSNGLITRTSIKKNILSHSESDQSGNESVSNLIKKAVYHQKNQSLENAEEIYLNILNLNSFVGVVINNLADLYKERGDFEKALLYSKFNTSIYPDSLQFEKTMIEINKKISKKNVGNK